MSFFANDLLHRSFSLRIPRFWNFCSILSSSHDSLPRQYYLDSAHCMYGNPHTATTIVLDSRVGCGAGNSGCAGDSGYTAVERSCTPRTGSAD